MGKTNKFNTIAKQLWEVINHGKEDSSSPPLQETSAKIAGKAIPSRRKLLEITV